MTRSDILRLWTRTWVSPRLRLLERAHSTIRASWIFTCVAVLCVSWLNKGAAQQAAGFATSCKSDQFALFFCETELADSVSICLAHDSTISVGRIRPEGESRWKEAERVEEFTDNASPHGSNITLRLTDKSEVTTFFVDMDYYDLAPAIIATNGARVELQKCKLGSQKINSGMFIVNGKPRVVRLLGLQALGLAVRLTKPPAWPK